MKYQPPYGETDPQAPYINGDPSVGRRGSIPPAGSIEYPQREIVNVITAVGLTPADTDLKQLARSIQSGKLIFGPESGAASAYVVTLNPPPLTYYDGLFVWMIPTNANTGPATVNINGLGLRSIVRRGGAPLQAGDMPAGYKSLLTYSALHNNFELYGVTFDPAAPPGNFFPVLTANANLYVNGTTGDDVLYDGTSPTISGSHGPFKTIMRAINETFRYGPSVYTMTINIANGTYTENVVLPRTPGPGIVLNGASKTGTIINGVAGGSTIFVASANFMRCQNLRANGTQALGAAADIAIWRASRGGALEVENCLSGSSTNWVFCAHASGNIQVLTHNWAAGSTYQVACLAGASSFLGFGPQGSNAVMTLEGAQNCSQSFAYATESSAIQIGGPRPTYPSWVGKGFGTGKPFVASMNGTIMVYGLGPNFFPGNVAGTVDSGGQYA